MSDSEETITEHSTSTSTLLESETSQEITTTEIEMEETTEDTDMGNVNVFSNTKNDVLDVKFNLKQGHNVNKEQNSLSQNSEANERNDNCQRQSKEHEKHKRSNEIAEEESERKEVLLSKLGNNGKEENEVTCQREAPEQHSSNILMQENKDNSVCESLKTLPMLTSNSRIHSKNRNSSNTNNYNNNKGNNETDLNTDREIRETQEYLAAWDLELWKAVQADRFRCQMQKYKEKAMKELHHYIDTQKAKAQEEVKEEMREILLRERKLHESQSQLDDRERRLNASEQEVRTMKRNLIEAEHRAEEEIRLQVRRANEELRHKLSLMQQRVKAADLQVERADERQRQAQREYVELYEEFARFRTRQVTGLLQPATAGKIIASSNINNNKIKNNNTFSTEPQPSSSSSFPYSLGNGTIEIDNVPANYLNGVNTVADQSNWVDYTERASSAWELRVAKLKIEHADALRALEEKHSCQLMHITDQLRLVESKNKQLIAAIARRREQLQCVKRELELYKNKCTLSSTNHNDNTNKNDLNHFINNTEPLKTKSTYVNNYEIMKNVANGSCHHHHHHREKGTIDTNNNNLLYINNEEMSHWQKNEENKSNASIQRVEHLPSNVKEYDRITTLTNDADTVESLQENEKKISTEAFTDNNTIARTSTKQQWILREINRLINERELLLEESKGAISNDDEVIRQVNSQIQLLKKQLKKISKNTRYANEVC